jgi:nitric oxide dioxygenase
VLTESSAAVVTATLPAVQAHGEAITGRFYQRMFAAHPELLDLFNLGNQATGQQRAALAAAVVAYAEHLTGQSRLPWGPVLDRIAHKHASLGITATQYPIVGRHLLAAVGEVLGDAVTAEVATAWDEVYWLLACELIAREAQLYTVAGVGLRAGAGWRPWRVADKLVETPDVTSFILVPAHGGPTPGFVPGQYTSVLVELADGRGQQIRQYSLSGRPGAAHWRITVKRISGENSVHGHAPDGAVSSHLHERVSVGDVLRLSPAFGEVSAVGVSGADAHPYNAAGPDPATAPLLLVSAGIGVTPAMAALAHLAAAAPAREIVLVHADRSGWAHALRHELPTLQQQLPNLSVHLWYEDAADGELAGLKAAIHPGRVDPTRVPLAPGAWAHLCGPVPFMSQVRTGLIRRGLPAQRIAYEVFGPGMLRD